MANFEHNVMVALYWGGEIITEMNGCRYTECARMIINMYTSMKYVELVELLHEKWVQLVKIFKWIFWKNILVQFKVTIQGSLSLKLMMINLCYNFLLYLKILRIRLT